jgi:hypothetical protein
MLIALGLLFLAIGGGLLHDVPFPRFIAAFFCIILGDTLMRLGGM